MRTLLSPFSCISDCNENLEQKTSYSSRVSKGERYDRGKYANCYFLFFIFHRQKLDEKKKKKKPKREKLLFKSSRRNLIIILNQLQSAPVVR